MDQQFLLEIMAVFTGIAALALLIQMGMMIGMYMVTRRMQEKINQLMPKIETLTSTSLSVVQESRTKIVEITAKTNEILDSTKRQVVKVEGLLNDATDSTRRQLTRVETLLNDATDRAKVQMDRAELVLDDAMTRAQQTVSVVHTGIMKPIREINGITVGVRAALKYFLRGRSPNPEEVTADEEMFI